MVPLAIWLIWPVAAIAAGLIAQQRGGSAWRWLLIGLAVGPFAPVVAVLALALNNHKPCPACGKRIERHAWKCPYCQDEFGPFPV
jgi:hypothetical protein